MSVWWQNSYILQHVMIKSISNMLKFTFVFLFLQKESAPAQPEHKRYRHQVLFQNFSILFSNIFPQKDNFKIYSYKRSKLLTVIDLRFRFIKTKSGLCRSSRVMSIREFSTGMAPAVAKKSSITRYCHFGIKRFYKFNLCMINLSVQFKRKQQSCPFWKHINDKKLFVVRRCGIGRPTRRPINPAGATSWNLFATSLTVQHACARASFSNRNWTSLCFSI